MASEKGAEHFFGHGGKEGQRCWGRILVPAWGIEKRGREFVGDGRYIYPSDEIIPPPPYYQADNGDALRTGRLIIGAVFIN